ncbi:MAG: twin-arginine translocase subunit TatC [Bacteroidales bacterium]|jgi:sec-independent protein translocase protein TatC|nr:twin-arginine translocase subunit TatC [Bacteroidales bacterium]HOI32313.1 twin-arginine translocase subunit TatC [Bacteroidales bacterium]
MAKHKQSDKDVEMSFWEHMEELRWHIVRSVIAVVVLSIIAFLNRKMVFDFLVLAPGKADFFTNRMLCKAGELLNIEAICMDDLNLQIININMSGQFLTHMYISFITGLVLAFPFVLNEIWRFVKPGLREGEARYSSGAVFISSLLFFLGVLFSYFLIVPLTINFLGTYQVSETVTNQISLQSYISTVISVIFAVGLVFELPILIYFLTKIGLITPAFMRRNRKYTIVILLIISAVITPPDVFSQILVVIPLIALYEMSILVSDRIARKQSRMEKG